MKVIMVICMFTVIFSFAQDIQKVEDYLEWSISTIEANQVDTIIISKVDGDTVKCIFSGYSMPYLLYMNLDNHRIHFIPLININSIQGVDGNYYFHLSEYKKCFQKNVLSSNDLLQERTIDKISEKEEEKNNYNPDGEIGIPYLILSGGFDKGYTYIPNVTEKDRWSYPVYGVGLILPISESMTLRVNYFGENRNQNVEGIKLISKKSIYGISLKFRLK